jgi:hypothetical protein
MFQDSNHVSRNLCFTSKPLGFMKMVCQFQYIHYQCVHALQHCVQFITSFNISFYTRPIYGLKFGFCDSVQRIPLLHKHGSLNCEANVTVFCFHVTNCVHKIFAVLQGQRKLVSSEVACDIR